MLGCSNSIQFIVLNINYIKVATFRDNWFPSGNRVPLNLWTKLLRFKGVGKTVCNFFKVPSNNELVNGKVLSYWELLDGTVPSSSLILYYIIWIYTIWMLINIFLFVLSNNCVSNIKVVAFSVLNITLGNFINFPVFRKLWLRTGLERGLGND